MKLLFKNVSFFKKNFIFGCACSMWKFPDQGSNLHHSSDPSHCSDNARSLTSCPTRELQRMFLYSILASVERLLPSLQEKNFFLFFFYFFASACGMRKLPGQGLNHTIAIIRAIAVKCQVFNPLSHGGMFIIGTLLTSNQEFSPCLINVIEKGEED